MSFIFIYTIRGNAMETTDKIILYTIHCPNCKVLERKLQSRNIPFEICDDINKMEKLGIRSAPVLSINGELNTFANALRWVNSYGNNA